MFKLCLRLHFVFLLSFASAQNGSNYVQADPFYLYKSEKDNFSNPTSIQVLDIRPLYKRSPNNKYYLFFKSSYYYNDNAPNLENTSDIWVGKGSNLLHSLHLNYSNSFLSFSIEPFTYISQNKFHISQFKKQIDGKYTLLNDGVPHTETPYTRLGFRESQVYVHKNGFGFGASNANMWWGPGIHNSLNMTNNTTGFPHIMVGSVSEQKWRNYGLNFRYYFSKFDKNNQTQPFFTALLGSVRFYSKPIISVGLMRTFLSGGNISDEELSIRDAMVLPFQSFFKSDLVIENDFLSPQDDVDQTFSGYINILFPESKFKLYLEYGWNDHRWDWHDFRAYPDHSGALCVGTRKFGLFNNPDYLIGFEYYNNSFGRVYNNPSPAWYGKEYFHYSSYNGRRYTAHSGSNSDDLLLFFGEIKPKSSYIVSFNYERHGLEKSLKTKENTGALPEVKIEAKLDYRYKVGNYNLLLFYEFEYLENVGFEYSQGDLGLFIKDIPVRKSNVFGIGFERDFGNLFQ
jgi:hypothetical protein